MKFLCICACKWCQYFWSTALLWYLSDNMIIDKFTYNLFWENLVGTLSCSYIFQNQWGDYVMLRYFEISGKIKLNWNISKSVGKLSYIEQRYSTCLILDVALTMLLLPAVRTALFHEIFSSSNYDCWNIVWWLLTKSSIVHWLFLSWFGVSCQRNLPWMKGSLIGLVSYYMVCYLFGGWYNCTVFVPLGQGWGVLKLCSLISP